jgi:predicted helicase
MILVVGHYRNQEEKLRQDRNWRTKIVKCLYRPFDIQYIYFSKDLLERPVLDGSGPLLTGGNYVFVGMRQVVLEDVPYTHFAVSQYPVEARCFRSNKGIVQVFPLFVYSAKKESIPNIGRIFREHLCQVFNKEWSESPSPDKIDPFSILCYVTAITFSKSYRERYSEILRRDFPKIPLIANYECFKELAKLGESVIEALTLTQKTEITTRFPVEGTNMVEAKYPIYDNSTGRIRINPEQYFEGINEPTWEYQLGGRQILFEWLKERRRKELTYDDKNTFQRIAVSIVNLINISEKIDQLLETCSGQIIAKNTSTAKVLADFTN